MKTLAERIISFLRGPPAPGSGRIALIAAFLIALTAFAGCADVDSPWKVAPRGDDAWSIGWIIASVLVAGTLAAGIVRLRMQLARKRHLTTRPSEPLPPLPRAPVIVLIASVVVFVAPILMMVGIFLERSLTLVETVIFLGLMALGAIGLRWASHRLTSPADTPRNTP